MSGFGQEAERSFLREGESSSCTPSLQGNIDIYSISVYVGVMRMLFQCNVTFLMAFTGILAEILLVK